jgi:uncharacterized protein
MPLSIEEIQRKLTQHRSTLKSFGVARLMLFGSTARGEAREDSDLDFLVELSPKTFRNYMGLKSFLEEFFGMPVDLATPESLKPRLRERVLLEARDVA